MRKIFWIIPSILAISSCVSFSGLMNDAIGQAADDIVESAVKSSDGSAPVKTSSTGPVSLEPTRENVIAALQSSDYESLKTILADVDDVKTIVNDDDMLLHMAEESAGTFGVKNPIAELLVEKKAYILQRDENGRSWEQVIQDMEVAATPRHNFIMETVGDKFQQRYKAIQSDNLAEFKTFEKYGPMDGLLLWEASRAKASDIVRYMVAQGADVNFINPKNKDSVLNVACDSSFPSGQSKDYNDLGSIIKALLDAGADPNTVAKDGFTPLIQLTHTELGDITDSLGDPVELYRMLLEAGADPRVSSSSRPTPLVSCVGDLNHPNPAVVEMLIDYGSEITDMVVRIGTSELSIIQVLVSKGADVHAMARTRRRFFDDESGQLKYFRYMLSAGADVNDFDLRDTTYYTANARYLINLGADINVRYPRKNDTFLHNAVINSKPDLVELLINAGAEINAIDDDGQTPLDELRSADTMSEAILRNAGGKKAVEL